MFKKYIISISCLWIGLACFSYFILHSVSIHDQQVYHRLMNFSDQVKKERDKEKSSQKKQIRYDITKQIFYKKEQSRLQTRLSSKQSELFFDSKHQISEFTEHFQGLTGILQENIIKTANESSNLNEQSIRYFKAQQASLSYQTGLLEAEDVQLAHYLIPGTEWPSSLESFSPLFRGKARKIQLTLIKNIYLEAQEFQLNFYDWNPK